MFCSQCGNKNEESAKFCSKCGHPVESAIAKPLIPVSDLVSGKLTPTTVPDQPVEPVSQMSVPIEQVAQVQGQTAQVPVQEQVNVAPQVQTPPVQGNVMAQQTVNQVPNGVLTPVNNGFPQQQFNNQMPYVNQYVPQKKKGGGFVAGLVLIAVVALVVYLASGGISFGGSKKRTMMIYISASNLESEAAAATSDLGSIIPSKVDLTNMNVLVYAGGTKKWYNGFNSNENAIYELTQNGFEKKKTYSTLNMSEPSTLAEFLNYSYKNYKADKYDLIIYSHGGAWSGAIVDDHYSQKMMSLDGFRRAFEASPFNSGNKLEGIIFRTCINGNYETASVLKNYANYMVASEEVTWGGAAIHVLDFINNINGSTDFVTIGNEFAESYYNNTVVKGNLNSTVMAYATIDLSKMDNLMTEVDNFFTGLDINKDYQTISRARSNVFQYANVKGGDKDFDVVDLYNLVSKLNGTSTYNSKSVLDAFDNTVVSCYTNSKGKYTSKCLSIYFPYNGSKDARDMILQIYNATKFDEKYYQVIKDFNFKKNSSETSSAMLQLDNGRFKNDIEISNKVLKLALADDEKNDIINVKYHVFKKNGNNYQEIKYGDDVIIDGNNLTINLQNNYLKLDNSYLYLDYLDSSYSTNGYLTKEKDVKDTDKVIYDIDDKGTLLNASKVSSGDNSLALSLLKLDDYDTYYFSSYTSSFNNKINSNWKEKQVESKINVKKNDLHLAITTLDSGEYYCMLEVYDVNNNVHYTSLNKIN